MTTLLEQIKNAQITKGAELEAILIQFRPLIFKLCGRLHYEDAQNDLEAKFINLIINLDISKFMALGDKAILSYLKKSMYNYYIWLSKRQSNLHSICDFSNLNEYDTALVQNATALCDDDCDNLFFKDIRKYLNEHEYNIIYLHYYLKYTIPEISQYYSCSRQSINQTKNRALTKLKNKMFNNEN